MIGPTVIDPDDHRSPILQVRHTDIAGQWQRRMRCRNRSLVEDFAVGRAPTMESITVPGRGPHHAVAVGPLAGHIGMTGDHIRAARQVDAPTLRDRIPVGDETRARPDTQLGIKCPLPQRTRSDRRGGASGEHRYARNDRDETTGSRPEPARHALREAREARTRQGAQHLSAPSERPDRRHRQFNTRRDDESTVNRFNR